MMDVRLNELISYAIRSLDQHLDTVRSAGVALQRAVCLAMERDGRVTVRLGTGDFIADAIDEATAPVAIEAAAEVRRTRVPLAVAVVRGPSGTVGVRVRAIRIAGAELPS